MEKVNLAEKFSLFTSHWDPKIVGEVNGLHVKLGKFQGTFAFNAVLFDPIRQRNDDELAPLACKQGRSLLLKCEANWAFERLAGEPGAVHAAEDSGFGRAKIVAVEAGDWE